MLCSIIDENYSSEVVVVGDFDAKPDGVYFAKWRAACEQYSLAFSDVRLSRSYI